MEINQKHIGLLPLTSAQPLNAVTSLVLQNRRLKEIQQSDTTVVSQISKKLSIKKI